MKFSEVLKKVSFQFLLLIIFLFFGFLNYCILQIVGFYFLPITIIPIFLTFLLEKNVSVFVIIASGLFDDLILNAPIGIYTSIYLILSCFSLSSKLLTEYKKYSIFLFLTIVVIINILTHKYCCPYY